MILSGLNNIDFAGLGSFSGVVAPADAANLVWDAMPWGASVVLSRLDPPMSVADFKNKVSAALSSKYQMIQSDSVPGNVVDNSVISGPYGENAGTINGVLDSLKTKGYYIVSAATPVQSQAPSPSSNAQSQPGAVSSMASQASKAVQSFVAPIASSFSRPPTRYLKVPYKQTPADKQRLIWIIGGMGLIFAIAIGAIAARD